MTSQILGELPDGDSFASRYEVQQQLGKKAGRRTLLARDRMTGELVVVKLLSFNSDFEWDDLKLFEREAETLKSLSHTSIPRYLDYFEVNTQNFKGFALVQTYIPAQSLEQYLKAGRTFTEAEVKEIAKAILEILIYLHEQNPPVIHRDIKPSNILLSDRSGNSVGQVYLVDFGSVQTVAASEGSTVTVVGTYGYMPPEQFGGRTVPASDLYSLGATLIYLVTGTHPADLPQKDFRIQFEQIVNLTPALSHWLKWMTELSLERRLPSALKALEALENPQVINSTALSITKPIGSKITLTKNADALEILIPPTGFKGSTAFMVLFAIAWNSFILFWTINALAAPFPANIPLALFSLPFWGAGLHMVYLIFSPILKRIRLHLDRSFITFTSEMLGLKFNRVAPTPTQEITKLVYTPRTFTSDFQGNRIEVPPQLVIWAGVNRYQIGGKSAPVESELEIEWLANELSNWLNLPIQRE
ncbi:serine/threonine-protein kinase [Chlorogloeopsis sp. ULAP02]|uniref:serine/threonine protein kinase n=1 Tax=Chlorogloeopsis sp. ULAP02 TaxID=3107926 RepID=UPI003136E6B0